MYSRVIKVTKEIVKKGISVGICLAMLLPILPLNFSFIMNTEKEAKAGLTTAPDYQTSKGDPNSYVGSDVRARLNNGLATSVPDSGTEAPTGKNYKLDSTATSDNTSGYAKSAFPDNESWSELAPITRFISDGKGSYHKVIDKVTIPSCVSDKTSGTKGLALTLEPEGIKKEGYAVPFNESDYSAKYITCTPGSDPTEIAGIDAFRYAQDIAVNETGKVNPIIYLSDMSQIVCASTLAELQSNGGTITKNLTKDSASSSARMCFYRNESGLGYFNNISIDENGRVGFGGGIIYKTCVAMAMKKNGNNIEIITSSSDVFDEGIYGYWIDFGKTKEELKEYVFYAWQEAGGDKYASAGYMTGAYWEGDNLRADLNKGKASAFDGFKGIVFGNSMVGYQGTVPFGNRTWRYLGNDYFVQEQPENVVFNASTAGYGVGPTGINLSDELRNGIELTTTGSPVEIPTDGISLTGFPANAPISFQYYYADIWRDGTPKDAGSYYVIVCVWSEGFEPKYSLAFPLTVDKKLVPKYTAPTKKIDAIWLDKAKDKLPSDLADHFGYPKTASGANIPGTWALVDENAEVGNVDGSNRPIGKFTPDTSVLDTYNWAGLSGWNATEGRLEVPALFTVAPMPADRLGCAQLSNWGRKYDGRPKSWVIKVKYNGAYISDENYDVVWPEDMTNAGTKTYTVNLKNNCTGTLTGTVAILKREIKITADNQNICYGDQLPQLTWKQSGESFVGSGSLIEGTVAVEESGNYPGPGNYNIIPSGFSTNDPTNYEVSHVNGTLAVGTDTFEITPRDISNATVTVTPASSAYTGGVHTPDVVLTDILNSVTKTLTLNTDYTLKWLSNMTNAGEQQGTATGQGNYQGSIEKTYTITAAPITASDVTLSYENVTYDGNAHPQTPTVTVGGRRLTVGTDYTVNGDTNPTNVSDSYKITITGQGNYQGNVEKTFAITAASSDDGNISAELANAEVTYNGEDQKVGVTVKEKVGSGTRTLQENVDYTKSYTDASGGNDLTNVGTKTVTITLQGNYSGTLTKTYRITAATIKDSDVALSYENVTYDGNAHPQTPTVTVGGRRLTVNKDYTVNGDTNPTNVSNSYKITIAGQGNYQGNVEKTFAITAASSDDGNISAELANAEVTYNGEDQKVGVTVKEKVGSGTRTLQENVDYTKSYTDASGGNDLTNVGTKTVTITLQGNYSGTLTKTYRITAATIKDSDVALSYENVTYDGNAHPQTPTVTVGGRRLTVGTDYTVSGDTNPTDVSNSYKITIAGQGNYQGNVEKTFAITAPTSGNVAVTLNKESFTYNGSNQTPTVTKVTFNEAEVPSSEYTANIPTTSTNADTYTVTVTLSANYGSKTGTATYTIERAPITENDVELSYNSVTYDGNAHPQTPTVTVGGRRLTVGTDYTVSGDTNPTNASDSYSITVSGKGNYSGTVTKTYAITKKSVSDSTTDNKLGVTTGSTTFTYNGSQQKLDVQITYNGETLQENVDYTKSYTDASGGNDITNQGTKTLSVTFIKNLNGAITRTYTINPLSITDSKVSFVLDPPSAVFTGSALTTEAKGTVTFSGTRKDLVKGTDFEFNCPSNLINKGAYTLEITGKGNYSGTLNKMFSITAASSDDGNISADLANAEVTYNGGDQKVGVTVKEKVGSETRTLQENVDYTKSYTDASGGNDLTNVGTKTVTITLQGNYSGTITKTYRITQRDITADSDFVVTVSPTSSVYTRSKHTPTITVKYKNAPVATDDWSHSSSEDMINAKLNILTIAGKRNFKGSKTVNYTITPKPITVTADSPSIYYGDSVPTLTVQKPGLVAGDSLSGSLKIKQTGKNGKTYPNADEYEIIEDEPFANPNYSITFNKGFLTINPKQVSDTAANGITMTVKPVNGKVFNGQRQTPDEVILKDGTKLLIEHVDYDLEYLTNMTDAITHKIKANLKGNYSGSKTADFIITPKQISDNTPESELKVDVDKTGYTDETGYTYDKTPKRPAVTIKAMFGNRTMQLTQGTHFDVNYLAENGTSDVTNVGPKKVVITFKNGFSGGKTIKYAINRRDVTIRPNERRRYYKTPDPDMRPRTNYDTINGLIAGDNLYGSFEREDPTNEEVGRYKIIQGTTLTNANNPNYNIIFKNEENTAYFIIEVDKSSWGKPQDYPKDHYVDDEGKTSTEVDKYGMIWLKETSDGTSAWYGIDNSKAVFRIGSRFWVMWLSEKDKNYKQYWNMLDEKHKRAMEALNGWIFLIGVTAPDGKEYEKFSEDENGETDEEKIVPTYVQIGDDWDENELKGVFISPYEDEDIVTTFVDDFEFPEGRTIFGKMMLHHFSPYFIYDEFTDAERKALEGNDDETNVLRTTVDIKGKTLQIIVSGPRRVLPEGTKLIADIYTSDNTCKIWLLDEGGNELPRPLSERVEVFIEMVDGMEDLIEVRLPKIGEDFHYGKFDGSWYGAIYTPYFPISLSLNELTDAERDELNKKRGLSGDKESDSDGGSSSSRNGSNAENDGQGDNETEELQPAENGSSNWWQNLSRTQIICITAAGILLLLLLIFLILLILKRRKEKENISQQ